MYADGTARENKFPPVINFNTAADVATVAVQRKRSLPSISHLLSIKVILCVWGGWPSGLTGQAPVNFKDDGRQTQKAVGIIH